MSKLSRVEPSSICNICGCEYEEDLGGVQSYFGRMPVTLCEICLPAMIDLVVQIIDNNEESYDIKPTEH